MKCKRDKILVLDAMPGRIKWTLFGANSTDAEREGKVEINRIEKLRDCPESLSAESIRIIAIHTPFGGQSFNRPVVLNAGYEREFRALTDQAPLHVPSALAAIDFCRRFFPRIQRVLFCETAFYVNLPERENSYALSKAAQERQKLRRYGYYGLYHAAAARKAAESVSSIRRKRVLSFCLDFRAELTAVVAGRPVMVTGGLSPLEGLPGMTMCGDLDPSIVLAIHKKKHWGPEKINRVLTESSGLFGLAGEKISFAELLLDERWKDSLARRLVEYRFKLAAGAGIAAMGGVDCLAFSGRFATAAEKTLGNVIRQTAACLLRKQAGEIPVYSLTTSIQQIVAEQMFDF